MITTDFEGENYEVIDGQRFSPPNLPHTTFTNFPARPQANTCPRRSSGSSSSHAPSPPDIDSRPPCPTPKGHLVNGIGQPPVTRPPRGGTAYDRINRQFPPDLGAANGAILPARPNGYSALNKTDKPPPLPPMNPNRRHLARCSSDGGTDATTHSPPRTTTLPANTCPYYATPPPGIRPSFSHPNGHASASTSSPAAIPVNNPTYNKQRSQKSLSYSTSNDSLNSSTSAGPQLHSDTYVRYSQEMSLKDFIEIHRSNLPMQVVVTKGYYGACERTSISDRDMFNIHFFKKAKVVKIKDSNNYVYTVPLNSAMEFGLVYRMPNGFLPPDTEYHFKTVGEIMQLKTLPKIVKATRSYKGSGPESSVEQYDLLLIKEIKVKRGLRNTKYLKCINAATGQKKSLSEDCMGYFSIRSIDVRLYLPEIIENCELPLTAILYCYSAESELPTHLTSSEIEIFSVQVEESLIATSILEGHTHKDIMSSVYENEPKSLPLVDIPASLDIEVAVIKLAEQETDQLYSETRHLFEKFDPGQCSYLNIQSDVTADTQVTLFSAIRPDQNHLGIDIHRPSNVFKSSPTLSMTKSSPDSGQSQPLNSPLEFPSVEEVHGRLDVLEHMNKSVSEKMSLFEHKITFLESGHPDVETQRKELISVRADIARLRRDTEEFRQSIAGL